MASETIATYMALRAGTMGSKKGIRLLRSLTQQGSNLVDRSEYYSQKCITRVFFCLGKKVYEVIGVQYSALCENEKNEKNQHPNPTQQE